MLIGIDRANNVFSEKIVKKGVSRSNTSTPSPNNTIERGEFSFVEALMVRLLHKKLR